MDQKFFRVPFAQSGDTQSIPDSADSNGFVSYAKGWGVDYAKDPNADINAKPVEREAMNSVLNAITTAVRQYQTNGYPEWISTANNNGAAYGYDAGVVVEYNGALYLSLSGNNTATPGANVAKWQSYIQREATAEEALAGDSATQVMTPRRTKALASYLDEQLKTTITTALSPFILPVGAIVLWGNAMPPSGWLELNGQAFNTGENPELAALYPSGRVPDWRGRFVRAWAHGSTIDPDSGRGIGSVQDYALVDHAHYAGIESYYRYDIPSQPTRNSPGGESIRQYSARTGAISPAPAVNVASEVRPTNIAAMYIIKTDKAESDAGAQTPSAIIISPATVTMNAGTSRQFTGTVLPSILAPGYAVSWAVSDATLGSISKSGAYTAIAGKSGTQTIIASISTGLTATATVTQQVYLTNITIGTAPSALLAGNSYSLPVTYSPATYTEMVNAASSDASVAALAADGSLTITGAGTTTLTLTGASSGVTASITITAIEVAAKEIYLQIADNLSEISSAGASAMQAARGNLGLKTLATKDALSAGDVGAVPQASTTLGTEDLNTITSPGRKFQSLTSNATTARHYPVVLPGMLDVIKTADNSLRQIYYPYNSTDVYHRFCVNVVATTLVFSEWASSGNFLSAASNLADVADKATARSNLGVGYTVSTQAAPINASGYADGYMWYQVEE
ncbi:tail fiber protein [Phytobacter diazotrophicus]|uniref:tail fiber protein n=1 Tax=Phytobacter diazotrophicus TaxID=395631 RepID=UPI0013EE2F9A|nr:tail fiber protein [Phytobacter diazotrophicus]MDU7131353.1 tail fiber protein [Enterobacteriaceae bacterium]QIH64206.1 phage tail protein [Enterobacteriaceae bacterium A-F18]